MADYVSVLKSAIDGLAENTPEGRADLYDKAREALKRQLEALDTAMSDEQRSSQLAALDDAVNELEATFAADDTDALLQAGLIDALGSATETPADEAPAEDIEEEPQGETDKPALEEEVAKSESTADAAADTEIDADTAEESSEPEPAEPTEEVKAEDAAGEQEQPDNSVEDQSAVDTEQSDDDAEKADGDETPAGAEAEQAADGDQAADTDQTTDADVQSTDESMFEAAVDNEDSSNIGEAEKVVTGAALAASTRDRLKAAFGSVEERFPAAKPDEDDADPLSRVHSAVEEIEAFAERKEPQISEVIPFTAAKAAVSGNMDPEESAPQLEPEPITAPLPESEPQAELNTIKVEPIEIPGERGSSNAWVIWLGVALVVAAGGAWGYMNRDTVMPVLQSLTEKARQMDEASPPAEAPKIDDRVPAADADGTETADATAPDGGEEAATETAEASAAEEAPPETPTVAETDTDANAGAEGAAVAAQPAGSESAILYEEGAGADGADLAHSGAVTWTVIREPIPNGPDQTVLQGQSSVAPNGVGFSVTIRKNTDETLPASHTIDLFFTVPADYAFGSISNIGGLLMKANEPERGDALIGAAAKVTDGFFIIGLSEADNDRTFNLDLLKSRSWFDIPLLFDSGKRGILTLAKGDTGTAAFIEAFASWEE